MADLYRFVYQKVKKLFLVQVSKRKELLEQETMMIKNDSISKSGNTGNSGCGKSGEQIFFVKKTNQ